MLKFRLTFEMNNDAFKPDWNQEAARILRQAAADIERGNISLNIRDINGNSVGHFAATKEIDR